MDTTAGFQAFLSSFIPMFVAIDIVGVLPFFMSLTADFQKKKKMELIHHATITAFLIALIFLFAGKIIFNFLGINENDFRIAGGLILLIISITDITASRFLKPKQVEGEDTFVGVVPIGIPLIMGPAAMTTILFSVDNHGWLITLLSLILNLLIVLFFLRRSEWVVGIIGESGSRAMGKVMALFLAAIAVMMIRVGLSNLVRLH